MKPDTDSPQLQCPICKTNIFWNQNFPHRPFCSERCKLIDLGEWASEGHVIAGKPLNETPSIDDEFMDDEES